MSNFSILDGSIVGIVFVAVKGFSDIKSMLTKLARQKDDSENV